jgi:hypothetical protein
MDYNSLNSVCWRIAAKKLDFTRLLVTTETTVPAMGRIVQISDGNVAMKRQDIVPLISLRLKLQKRQKIVVLRILSQCCPCWRATSRDCGGDRSSGLRQMPDSFMV